jgi:hypothetical protein
MTVDLGGLVVGVLPIGLQVRGFKPGQGRWIFKGVKIHSTTSSGGELKLSLPCRKTLRHFKEPCWVWKRYFVSSHTTWFVEQELVRAYCANQLTSYCASWNSHQLITCVLSTMLKISSYEGVIRNTMVCIVPWPIYESTFLWMCIRLTYVHCSLSLPLIVWCMKYDCPSPQDHSWARHNSCRF